ncbi:hypothetical protein INR49_016060 [Caranx melampygus]|nr:hypothetical protein INR49_016060 [Caranx melampygus]
MDSIPALRTVSGTWTAQAGKNAARDLVAVSAVILQVSGALQSDEVSVYYLSSWPVHPYRTATSLLIDCNATMSLHNVTSKLHLLLKHIVEVSSVTVEDVDECEESALCRCSAHADCVNTVGSYQCTCRQGYVDVDPGNPGANCTADVRVWTTTETPLTYPPPMNVTCAPASSITQDAPDNSTTGVFSSSEISMTTPQSHTTSVPYNSSHTPQWTASSSNTSMNATVESPPPATTCPPPSITTLMSSNVTGTSFCVYWSSHFQENQTYRVAVSKGSEGIQLRETSQTMMAVTGLQPGALDATARLTNIQFTADLQNTSSQAYYTLNMSIIQEIYQALSPEMQAMVDSGQVRIEIRSFSLGSVVVNFTLIFTPSQSQDIRYVSMAVLNSLMNSSKYTVDKNNTSVSGMSYVILFEYYLGDDTTVRDTHNTFYSCLIYHSGVSHYHCHPNTNYYSNINLCHHQCPYNHHNYPNNHHNYPHTTTAAMTSNPPTMAFNPSAFVTTSTAPSTSVSAPRTAPSVSMLKGISVQCRVAAITVTLDKDFLQNNTIRESALYLGLEECGVNGGNDTHVQLTVAWDDCDTRLVHNDTHYTASVTLSNTMDSYTYSNGTVEIPKKQLEVPIMCTYTKSMVISADFGSMGYTMIKDIIMGLGSFQVTVQLMNGTVPLPHNYSMSPDEVVVVEVSLNTSSEQIKVIINKCWATSTPNPADTYSYTFVENSCSLNAYTKVLMNGNSSTSQVSVQIFSFVNLNVIYLHCQVHICVEIGSDTCVPDCFQRTARSSNTIGTAFGSSGPLLRLSLESFEDEFNTLHVVGFSCLGIGLTLFFIIGLICIFYCQRNRIGHYNFSVKPKEENFTYLVFNT